MGMVFHMWIRMCKNQIRRLKNAHESQKIHRPANRPRNQRHRCEGAPIKTRSDCGRADDKNRRGRRRARMIKKILHQIHDTVTFLLEFLLVGIFLMGSLIYLSEHNVVTFQNGWWYIFVIAGLILYPIKYILAIFLDDAGGKE